MNEPVILVVDDSPADLELTVAALSEHCAPQRIGTAPGGEEALDYLLGRGPHAGRDTRRQPRLVILDLRLGLTHGLDVLHAMRAHPRTESIPVVMLSGSGDKAELDRCYAAGANSVVRKSADYEELRRKMKQVYGFWMTVNEGNRDSLV